MKKVELYFAGEGWGKSCDFLYGSGYPRLLSYVNNRTRADKYIYNKIYDERRKLMDLYLAGDSSGLPQATPQLMIEHYNVLLSYMHPKGKFSTDKVGEVKRGDDSMDLYLVGPEKENIMKAVTEEMKSNMLFNYIDGKRATDKYKEQIKPKKLFIDSGAFSAWTKGKEIDVDEYIAWINERADFIDLYGQIDVIPGDRIKGHTQEQVEEAAQATWENYLYMRPRMKKPEGLLYTFHVGEPYSYLEQALDWRDEEGNPFPYMALGGMVGKSMPIKRAFLDTCFRIIKNSSNPKVKVHAFGMTSFPLLEQYPIASADSTSWIMTGANGSIMTEVGIIAISDQMSKLPEHYSHLPKDLQEKFEETISEYGFTLDELRHSRDNRIMLNARYMNKKASELEYNPGPKQFSLF